MKVDDTKENVSITERVKRRCRLSLIKMEKGSSLFTEDDSDDEECPNLDDDGKSEGFC